MGGADGVKEMILHTGPQARKPAPLEAGGDRAAGEYIEYNVTEGWGDSMGGRGKGWGPGQ
jgi:hypothetical protein